MMSLWEHKSDGSTAIHGGSTELQRGSMKARRRFATLMAGILLVLGAMFVFAGCGGEPMTIEDYLAESPAAQEEIESSLSGIANGDMDVTVSYEGNRILINCEMKTTYKKKVLKSMKKAYKKYMKKKLTEPMEGAISAIEQETGIEGVSILVTINNGNGKEMWSQLYPLELAEQEAAAAEASAAEESAESTAAENPSEGAEKSQEKTKDESKEASE